MESAAVGLPFGVRAPIAGTLPVREASAPSGADAAPSAGKRLVAGADCDGRSEEHTSELQSLMRNSYAVFCLKKKKTRTSKHKAELQEQIRSSEDKVSRTHK